jgi:hypothetical protein
LLPRRFGREEDRGAAWLPITEEDHELLDFRAEREDRDELRLVGIYPSLCVEIEVQLHFGGSFKLQVRDNVITL